MIIPISELKPDALNANKHSERGSSMVSKSLSKYGAGRSILLDRNKHIIAGNLTAEEAGQIGMENVQIVESDGTKLIAVMRTDVDIDSAKGRGLALADNRSAEVSLTWDTEVLQQLKEEYTEVVEELWSGIEFGMLIGKPDFERVGIETQSRLDEKKKVICPKCDYEFTNLPG
jgi:sporulation protein YlmC with PRC-barrel domain